MSQDDQLALAIAKSIDEQVFLDADLESALALSASLATQDEKQTIPLELDIDAAIAASLATHSADCEFDALLASTMQQSAGLDVKHVPVKPVPTKNAVAKPGPTKIAIDQKTELKLNKERHVLHDAVWVVVTGYPDGSAVVNASFVWQSGRDPVADIKAGHIVGQAPFCFLITLFHMNTEFFMKNDIVSPYALAQYLTQNGMPPKQGYMYVDETILPVARHFQATIYMNFLDVPKHSHPVNDKATNVVFLVVNLNLSKKHYVSGLE